MMKPLLIPLTYFCLQTWLGIPQAKCQVELNMMEDSFDDQYLGCEEEMDKKAPELLQREMFPFSQMWKKATEKWNRVKTMISRPNSFKDEYGIAIVAYTDRTKYTQNKIFSTVFNDAVSRTKRSRAAYMTSFQFKAFHYYLTRGLQLLWKEPGEKCGVMYKMTLYRGVNKSSKYKGQGPIRFGYFASSSIKREAAESFGTATFFTIHTCFGVKIQEMSYNPEQKEVLIPVNEIFSVTKIQENNIYLQSTNRNCSHFNCAYLGGKMTQTCVHNSATRGGLAFLSVLSPSLFGGSVILIHVAAMKLFAGL